MPQRASRLVLGWELTPTGDPRYWVTGHPRRARQPPNSELVTVAADLLDTHTVMIAQSGSGKSYFLGRLIEEIVLRTKAQCVIFDPNGDFRFAHLPEKAKLWRHPRYDPVRGSGRLPVEPSKRAFVSRWSRVKIRLLRRQPPGSLITLPYREIRLWWPSLSIDVLTGDLDESLLRTELYHVHALVKPLEELAILRAAATREPLDLLSGCERLYQLFQERKRNTPSEGLRDALRGAVDAEFPDSLLLRARPRAVARLWGEVWGEAEETIYTIALQLVEPARQRIQSLKEHTVAALLALQYGSEEAARLYFGRLRQYASQNLLAPSPREAWSVTEQLHVIDLPSLADRSAQLLTMNATLSSIWDIAKDRWEKAIAASEEEDRRVPHFIVLDEAHNFIPKDPKGRAEWALREQFRTIVAEGRKFGLFLILVSQRPDKLDTQVVSECENVALMKLSTPSVLALTRELLRLEEVPERTLEKCLQLGKGRVLLAGRWTEQEPRLLYAAARRTREGGRNLPATYWTAPFRDRR